MMKKIFIIFAILMAAFQSQASSYFTTGVRDTVLIHPMMLGLVYEIPIHAHFESRFDSWTMNAIYPAGLDYDYAYSYSGMDVPYVKSDGTSDIYEAILTVNDTAYVYSSTITEYGYWDPDNDGIYETYGTVKWEPGECDSLFLLRVDVRRSYRVGVLTISGELISTYDARGGTGYDEFEKSIVVKVGYRKGDLTGDGYIDINDFTILNGAVLGAIILNEFQLDSGDINGDGLIDINDVTDLLQIILS